MKLKNIILEMNEQEAYDLAIKRFKETNETQIITRPNGMRDRSFKVIQMEEDDAYKLEGSGEVPNGWVYNVISKEHHEPLKAGSIFKTNKWFGKSGWRQKTRKY